MEWLDGLDDGLGRGGGREVGCICVLMWEKEKGRGGSRRGLFGSYGMGWMEAVHSTSRAEEMRSWFGVHGGKSWYGLLADYE